ncbi:MAG: beta-phosphoglucomutase, partial [Flavobacteriales bacterium]|nr:beta-phosphoglucomutase [Flavobacteriales bacterium]
HCVVFEDAVAGIEAAKAGGMRSIGIGTDDNLGAADLVRASLAEIHVEEALNIL